MYHIISLLLQKTLTEAFAVGEFFTCARVRLKLKLAVTVAL
jgi:hypothetical protein